MYGDGGGGVPNLEVTNAFQSETASIVGTQSPHLATASCLQCSFAVVVAESFVAFGFFLAVVLFNNIVRAFSNHSWDVSNVFSWDAANGCYWNNANGYCYWDNANGYCYWDNANGFSWDAANGYIWDVVNGYVWDAVNGYIWDVVNGYIWDAVDGSYGVVINQYYRDAVPVNCFSLTCVSQSSCS